MLPAQVALCLSLSVSPFNSTGQSLESSINGGGLGWARKGVTSKCFHDQEQIVSARDRLDAERYELKRAKERPLIRGLGLSKSGQHAAFAQACFYLTYTNTHTHSRPFHSPQLSQADTLDRLAIGANSVYRRSTNSFSSPRKWSALQWQIVCPSVCS